MLTKDQKAVLQYARDLGCQVYCDAPRDVPPADGKRGHRENRRTRIKGQYAHDHKLVVLAQMHFGADNVRWYQSKSSVGGFETPALSIRRENA